MNKHPATACKNLHEKYGKNPKRAVPGGNARAAHELEDRLGLLRLNVDRLHDIVEGPAAPSRAEVLDILELMQKNIQRLEAELAERSSPRRLEARGARLDINALVLRVTMGFVNRFREEGILLEFNLQKGLPMVFGISDDLEQIFVKLIEDAADATAGNSTKRLIRISTAVRGKGVAIKANELRIWLSLEEGRPASAVKNPALAA